MKKIEIKEEKYLGDMVTMLMGLVELEVRPRTLFLVELVRESKGGVVVVSEVKEKLKERLGLGESNFKQLLRRLELGGHVRRDGGLVYLEPRYGAVRDEDKGEGIFVVMKKKVDGKA